jgi:Ca2+-binding RTX toxin-like protein
MAIAGVNVSGANYYSGESPFLDRWKTAAMWIVKGADGSNLSLPVATDTHGWPLGVPAGASELTTVVELDPKDLATSDRYVLTYSGSANFRITNATIVSQEAGKLVLDLKGGDSISLSIKSIDAANPIHDIHLVREDQVDAFNNGEIFNPAFLDKVSDWGLVRFMDWQHTNGSTIEHFDQLATQDSANWSQSNGQGGVPLSVMIALCNQAGTDMWYSIPAEADDDFVKQAMTYIKDNLDPSLKVHLEYSNEVWNWGFAQSKYALAMGDKMWGVDANGDGRIDPGDAREHVADGWLQFYGYRSAQVADIANQIFGTEGADRLETVISTQTATEGREASIIKGIAKANLGSVGDLFDDFAITGYIGITLDETQILSWARSGDAGMAAAFDSLGLNDPTTGSIAKVIKDYEYYANVAAKYGLSLDVYESGAHFVASQYSTESQSEISNFFAKLIRDPRMAELYTMSIDAFKGVGGDVITAYTAVREPGKYGYWGLLDSIYDERSERYMSYINGVATAGARPDQPVLGPDGDDVLDGTNAPDIISGGNGHDLIHGLVGDDLLSGDAGNDTLYGDAGDDILAGGDGDDVLFGGDGNDVLDGGDGIDVMTGGSGNDTYVVDNIADVVIEAQNGGTDTIITSLTGYVLPDWVERLNYDGVGDFTGTGNALANSITGNVGNDTLNGMAGNDTMAGGAGDDTYIVDATGDVIVEDADGGTDTVRTSVARYTLAANVENLVFTATGAFTGDGNALANRIEGGVGNDLLRGWAGNDVLVGNAGNDTLDGGLGIDTMQGGLGNDVYRVDSTKDVVVEAANGGTDRVESSVSYTLSDNVEDLLLTGTAKMYGYGNALGNTITGNAAMNDLRGNDGNDKLYGGDSGDILRGGDGDDLLDGGTGADTMYGGNGDDIYMVDNKGDKAIDVANGGIDKVVATVDVTLSANIENLSLYGTAIRGVGNALANTMIDSTDAGSKAVTLMGLGGDDLIRGSGNDNVLNGGAGNDQLRGGGGDDTLIGGAGADKLWGDAGADRFVIASLGDLGKTSSTSDWINDFSSKEGDRIDLSAIDATSGTSRNDAFTFIGTGGFTGHAGELRVSGAATQQTISGDINGDGVADFVLTVATKTGWLTAADFIL